MTNQAGIHLPGVLPIMTYEGETLPEWCTLFRLQVFERVGILPVGGVLPYIYFIAAVYRYVPH